MTLLIFYQNICKASKHAFNIEKFKKFDHRMSRIENSLAIIRPKFIDLYASIYGNC